MEELEAKVDSEESDIVVVSETWFKEESNWRTGLEGSMVYPCDWKERRGGVAIWVKDSIASRERGDIKEGTCDRSGLQVRSGQIRSVTCHRYHVNLY